MAGVTFVRGVGGVRLWPGFSSCGGLPGARRGVQPAGIVCKQEVTDPLGSVTVGSDEPADEFADQGTDSGADHYARGTKKYFAAQDKLVQEPGHCISRALTGHRGHAHPSGGSCVLLGVAVAWRGNGVPRTSQGGVQRYVLYGGNPLA